MQLNHLDLPVIDVIKTKDFFEKFFGFSSITPKTSEKIAILKNEGGFSLVLQKLKDDESPKYPGSFHIGFLLDSVDKVYDTYEKLKSGLPEFNSEITENNRGTMFYFYVPKEKILIEVSCSK